jgi:predicted nucleic-acid-binding Zn-ribbon protein
MILKFSEGKRCAMKSGICPKCKSSSVFKRNFPGGYRGNLVIGFHTGVRLEDYICVICGYTESYLENLNKMDTIKEHCTYIAPSGS